MFEKKNPTYAFADEYSCDKGGYQHSVIYEYRLYLPVQDISTLYQLKINSIKRGAVGKLIYIFGNKFDKMNTCIIKYAPAYIYQRNVALLHFQEKSLP